MLDNANIRKDFPMLQKTMQSHPLVYLDSGATTLKPRQVIDAVVNYYENYGANAHRGDYDLSYFVDQEYEQTRKMSQPFYMRRMHVKSFIQAEQAPD